jgi:hypothetical protein
METMPVVGTSGHGFADVMAYAIAGDPREIWKNRKKKLRFPNVV